MTPAARLNQLLDTLRAERDALTVARDDVAVATVERAVTFDEDAARRELARAVALDAMDGTNTADEISARQEAERTRLAKEVVALQKRREKLVVELAEIDNKVMGLDAQIREAEALLAGEVAKAGADLLATALRGYGEAADALVKAAARLHAAHAVAYADIPHEREPKPFRLLVPNFWRDDFTITGGVDLGRGLTEVAEDVTAPLVRELHDRMRGDILYAVPNPSA
jgi:hypothetical protein